MRVLIVGCGYVGVPLGEALKQDGHEVFGLRRTPEGLEELSQAGIEPLVGDITKPTDLDALPGPFDWVVNTVSSTRGGLEEYRDVYLQGTKNLMEWLSGQPIKKFVYTSSTSVYGQTDSSVVRESSPTEPANPTSQVLVETENLLQEAAANHQFPAVILRAAGIYGPDRGHLFLKYLKNEARISEKGLRLINMIHRDDLVGLIIAALKTGRPGEIYNAADDEPVAQIHFLRWLSETLGKWMPPFVQVPDLPPGIHGGNHASGSSGFADHRSGATIR
jgi:nucleoside-diphosphate-sugar epimerase